MNQILSATKYLNLIINKSFFFKKMYYYTYCYQDGCSFANTHQIIVQSYDLKLHPNLTKRTLEVDTNYHFRCISPTKTIVLDTMELQIRKVLFHGVACQFTLTPHKTLGSQLTINLPHELQINRYANLRIQSFTDRSTSLTWGQFVFTQNQPIYCRSLFPCQDTPSVKSLFHTKVNLLGKQKDYSIFVTGIKKQDNSFEMKIPIPSYLFAFLIGHFKKKSINSQLGIIALEEKLEQYHNELEAMESYISQLQKITFPYQWEQYNVCILPMSFPYGGMQNPIITFASPSIITGDKSGTSVVIHEMAHSWTGNLVSCKNWENFWMNEGFTVYLQNRTQRKLYGEQFYQLNSIMQRTDLLKQIDNIVSKGLKQSYTSLYPILDHDNPDDAFSKVPYNKGYIFLSYLESLVGQDLFEQIVRQFLRTYRKKSVDYINFKDFFEQTLTLKKFVLKQNVDWQKWMRSPGYPIKSDFWQSQKYELVQSLINNLLNGLTEIFQKQFKQIIEVKSQLNVKVLQLFFAQLQQKPVTLEQVLFLQKQYNFSNTLFNFDLLVNWFEVCLKARYIEVINVIDEKVLKTIGRMKYINPLYQKIQKVDRQKCLNLYNSNKHLYSAIARSFIEKILNI